MKSYLNRAITVLLWVTGRSWLSWMLICPSFWVFFDLCLHPRRHGRRARAPWCIDTVYGGQITLLKHVWRWNESLPYVWHRQEGPSSEGGYRNCAPTSTNRRPSDDTVWMWPTLKTRVGYSVSMLSYQLSFNNYLLLFTSRARQNFQMRCT